MQGVKVTGIGIYLPERIVTNEEIAEILRCRRNDFIAKGLIRSDDPRLEQFNCDPDWIRQRTGIRERRHAGPNEATSDLAVKAAESALKMAGLRREAVEFVVLATVTPDHPATPPTASIVQHKLGLPHTAVFDVSVACSSFVSALELGYSLVRSGLHKAGLVIGADVMERIISWNDRSMLPLFGSAGGCFVLEETSQAEDQFGPNNFSSGSDGSLADLIVTPKGGSRAAIEVSTLTDPFDQGHTFKMQGRTVFKTVVPLMAGLVIPQALKKAGLRLEEVDAMIFHQANARITEPVVEQLGFKGVVYNNIERYGNTTSASIPLCLYEAIRDGAVKLGMRVLLVVFGGGLAWATGFWRCGLDPEEFAR